MMENINKRRLIVILALLIGAIMVYFIAISWDHSRLGKIVINVAPSDSTIKLNTGKEIHPGTIYLKPGHYTITASRDGFNPDSESVSAKKGSVTSVYLLPEPVSPAALKYLKDNPTVQTQREGIASQKVAETQAILQTKYPVIKYLPITTRYYSINYGQSKKYPDDQTALALYISCNPADRGLALGWIKFKGFDPSKYEIIYQDTQ